MRARSGINVADDGEDDVYDDVDVVHGSNGTLCNFFFALGGAGLLQGWGLVFSGVGVQQRDVTSRLKAIKVLWEGPHHSLHGSYTAHKN